MEFKLWSELNTGAKTALKPDMGLRNWDSLSVVEKASIWNHLEFQFFDNRLVYDSFNDQSLYTNKANFFYRFLEPDADRKREHIEYAIITLHNLYKVNAYTKNFIKERSRFNVYADFYFIFSEQSSNVVFELLSLYCKHLIQTIKEYYFRSKAENESQEDFDNLKNEWQINEFNKFADAVNETFSDFGLNVYLSQNGFIPKQDEKIIKEIYEPVLKSLAAEKWKEVNLILSDSFYEYRKNTPQGYSASVTHTVSAVQAFLQILIVGKTGSGDISKLLLQGQASGHIPNDMFSKEIFKTIESVLMRERQETGNAHPKKEYATEGNAKMILNITMIFIQHCLST